MEICFCINLLKVPPFGKIEHQIKITHPQSDAKSNRALQIIKFYCGIRGFKWVKIFIYPGVSNICKKEPPDIIKIEKAGDAEYINKGDSDFQIGVKGIIPIDRHWIVAPQRTDTADVNIVPIGSPT